MGIWTPARSSHEVKTSRIGESTASLLNRVEAIERRIVALRDERNFGAIETLTVQRNELLFALAMRND